MKIVKNTKPEKKAKLNKGGTKFVQVRNGTYAVAREKFEELVAIDPQALPTKNFMITEIKLRPVLSALAKASGDEYTTVGIGNDEMLVFKLDLNPKKKGKK